MKNIDALLKEIFQEAKLLTENKRILEANMKNYMTLQVKVAMMVANELNDDPDNIVMNSDFPIHLNQLLQECIPFYDKLMKWSI